MSPPAVALDNFLHSIRVVPVYDVPIAADAALLHFVVCEVNRLNAVFQEHLQVGVAYFPYNVVERPTVAFTGVVYQRAVDAISTEHEGVVLRF